MVKRIKGTVLKSRHLHKLNFCQKDGTEISKVELMDALPYGPEAVIADDEEIIGLYGAKENSTWNYILSLGFIVWKPPRI